MPTRGAKLKPEKLKNLGGRSHKKKENLIQFPVPEEIEKLPHEIRMEVEEIWKYLIDLGVANPVDWGAFSRYIELRIQYEDAVADVKERGMVLNKGNLKRERFNPSWRIQMSTMAEILRLEEQFGLTPSARRRLPAAKPQGKKDGYGAARQSKSA